MKFALETLRELAAIVPPGAATAIASIGFLCLVVGAVAHHVMSIQETRN